MLIKMKVSGLAIDPFMGVPIIILKDSKDKNSIPIWIGLFEASAIATQIENITPPRPITHDLMKNILESLDIKLIKIEINDLRDDTFYAVIYLKSPDGKTLKVDSRPSDAIALALRTDSPIYVDKKVIERSRKIDLTKEGKLDFITESKDKWEQILENLSPEDFGKYKM